MPASRLSPLVLQLHKAGLWVPAAPQHWPGVWPPASTVVVERVDGVTADFCQPSAKGRLGAAGDRSQVNRKANELQRHRRRLQRLKM